MHLKIYVKKKHSYSLHREFEKDAMIALGRDLNIAAIKVHIFENQTMSLFIINLLIFYFELAYLLLDSVIISSQMCYSISE